MTNEHSTPPAVRWGILGPGDIAATFARAIDRSPGTRCVAVGSRSIERAQTFADDHEIERAHGSYDDLVADPDVDVVYVATPQSLHHAHARLALEHGKGVLVEKPMSMDQAEAADLVTLARERNLFLMEGLWTLCHPLVARAVDLVRSGQLGELEAFNATCGPLPIARDHRALDATAGGGFYREVLIYPLAIWSALTGCSPATLAWATGRSSAGADYAAAAALRTDDGRYASVSGAFSRGVSAGATSPARLLLGDGWAELDDTFNPSSLRIVSPTGDQREHLGPESTAQDFEHEISEVVAAVRADRIESASVPHALSLHLAGLLDQVATQLHPTTHPSSTPEPEGS